MLTLTHDQLVAFIEVAAKAPSTAASLECLCRAAVEANTSVSGLLLTLLTMEVEMDVELMHSESC